MIEKWEEHNVFIFQDNMFPFDPSFDLICEGPKLEVPNCDVINNWTLKAIAFEIFGYIQKIRNRGCTLSKDFGDCLFWKTLSIY
jgi:hypothetical protein